MSSSGKPKGLTDNTGLDRRESVWQFIKFNLVGVMNTGVDFAVFALLNRLGLYILAAQCVSYAAGTVNSYFVNKFWTFGERGNREQKVNGSQFFRFAVLNGFTLALSLVLLYITVQKLGLHPLMAKVVVIGFTTVVNFAGSKLWVFTGGTKPQAQKEDGL